MSKVTTPKYVLEMSGFINHVQTSVAWKGRVPSVAKLEQIVMEHVVATYPGYANEHLGKAYGIQIPSYVRVRENFPGGRVMVEWKAPMFMVLPNAEDYPAVAKAVNFK
jgi:hypothetical protein